MAEGARLLSGYRAIPPIEGSNPSLSAKRHPKGCFFVTLQLHKHRWRGARVVEWGGLENRCAFCVPWVRIPPSPQVKTKKG